jgi:hypothetical protein
MLALDGRLDSPREVLDESLKELKSLAIKDLMPA